MNKVIKVQDVNKVDEKFDELIGSLSKIVNLADYKMLRDNLLLLSDNNENGVKVNYDTMQTLIKIREMLDEHTKLLIDTMFRIASLEQEEEDKKDNAKELPKYFNEYVVSQTDSICYEGHQVAELSYTKINLEPFFDKTKDEICNIIDKLNLSSFITLDISSYILLNNIKEASHSICIDSVFVEPKYRGHKHGIDAIRNLISENPNSLIYTATFASIEEYPTLDIDNGGENSPQFNDAVHKISTSLANKFIEYGFRDINPYLNIYENKVPMMYIGNEVGNKVFNIIKETMKNED